MLNGGIIWSVVTEPSLLVVLGLTAVLAWPLGVLLARLSGGRRGVAVGFVVVLGAVVAATGTVGAARGAYTLGWSHFDGWAGGFADTREKLANIGLYLPLGVLGGLLWRWRFVPLAAALSLSLELWQAVIGRGGDVVDVVHNTAGAALGVVAVAVARRTLRRKVPCAA